MNIHHEGYFIKPSKQSISHLIEPSVWHLIEPSINLTEPSITNQLTNQFTNELTLINQLTKNQPSINHHLQSPYQLPFSPSDPRPVAITAQPSDIHADASRVREVLRKPFKARAKIRAPQRWLVVEPPLLNLCASQTPSPKSLGKRNVQNPTRILVGFWLFYVLFACLNDLNRYLYMRLLINNYRTVARMLWHMLKHQQWITSWPQKGCLVIHREHPMTCLNWWTSSQVKT